MLMLFFLFILGIFLEMVIALLILGIVFHLTHQAYNGLVWDLDKRKKIFLLCLLIFLAIVFIFLLCMFIKLAFSVF